MPNKIAFAAVLIGLSVPLAARAQDQSTAPQQPASAQPDGAAKPAASTDATPKLRPLCTDRPTKSNNACTVDKGHFQLETDLVNASFLRQDGLKVDTYLAPNPTLKYGLTDNIDLELNFAPYEQIRTTDLSTGSHTDVSGISDLYLRAKINLMGNDSGNLAIALLPYVKAPTANRQLGNGVVEEGLLIPISYKLNDQFSVTIMPEFDALKDNLGGGRHFNTSQLVNLGWSVTKTVTLYGELWGDYNYDPAGLIRQYSADVAASWGLNDNLQLDGGLNFGLNRQTPGVQAYVGLSQRF